MLSIFRGQRPDVTPPQVIGFLAAAVGPVCVLAGVHLSPEQTSAIDNLRDAGIALFAGDALIRVGRNVHAAAKAKGDGLVAATVAANVATHTEQPPPSAPGGVDADLLTEGDLEHDTGLPTDDEEFAALPGGLESAVKADAPVAS